VALLAVAAAAAVATGARLRPDPDGDAEPPQGPAPRRHVSATRGGAALLAVVVLVHAAAAAGGPGAIDGQAAGPGAQLWQGGGAAAVIVDGRAREESLLAGLRDRGVVRLDIVVLRTAALGAAEVAATLRRRWPGVLVLGPAGSAAAARRVANLGSVAVPTAGTVVDVGGLRLTVRGSRTDRLDVGIVIRGAPPDSARAPPLPGR
jgi:hypothetical protein